MNFKLLASVLVAVALLAGTARADVPRIINFQGRLTTVAGTEINGQYLSITFSIYNVATGGTACFAETSSVYIATGLFNVNIGANTTGGVTGLNDGGVYTKCDFNSPYWLELNVNGDGAMTPRVALTASPYALRADVANRLNPGLQTVNGALTVNGAVTATGAATVGGTATVTGNITTSGNVYANAVYLTGYGNTPITYQYTTKRYIIEAPPSSVGKTIALDNTIMNELCRDKDGCRITTQMINWDGTGNVASRQWKLFLSETSNYWRVADNDASSIDNNAAVNDVYNAWDCYFSDAETYTGQANGRTDSAVGFGVLNITGGNNDTTTTCRWVIED